VCMCAMKCVRASISDKIWGIFFRIRMRSECGLLFVLQAGNHGMYLVRAVAILKLVDFIHFLFFIYELSKYYFIM